MYCEEVPHFGALTTNGFGGPILRVQVGPSKLRNRWLASQYNFFETLLEIVTKINMTEKQKILVPKKLTLFFVYSSLFLPNLEIGR